MATIVTRASKGSALTWAEGDANITNLNTAKLENLVEDTTPQLGGALDVNGQKIVSTANGNIELEPNGTGDVYLTADTIRLGDQNTTATLTTNGTGSLIINASNGVNTGSITITQGVDNNISIVPNGTGKTVVGNINYKETVFSRGSTNVVNLGSGQDGNIQSCSLNTTSLTINGLNAAGASVTLFVTNNGSVSTVTNGTGTWRWAGGSRELTATSGTVDVISIYYDGTTNFGSINRGFV